MLLGLYLNDSMILAKAFTNISHKTHTKNTYTRHTRRDTSTTFKEKAQMLFIYSIFF